MDLPKTMKALKSNGKDKVAVVTDAPVPEIPDGYALVKVSHVALNPTDWKHLGYPTTGLTVGCDFSGTVVKVSATAGKSLAVGDRVAGYAHGQKPGHPDQGCFAEYALTKVGLTYKLPPQMSFADAATLSLGWATIGLALYQRFNLPWPDQAGVAPSHSILIYGGSTVTGLLAIQMAKLSGWRVLATCSPHSFDLCRSAGADEVFDYRDPTACVKAIRESMGGKDLLYAFDCAQSKESPQICNDSLSQEKGKAHYVTINAFFEPLRPLEDMYQTSVFAYTSEGETFNDYGIEWAANQQDYSFTRRFFKLLEELLEEDKITCFPLEREGGLSEEGVIKGLGELRSGRVRGGKLVYRVA